MSDDIKSDNAFRIVMGPKIYIRYDHLIGLHSNPSENPLILLLKPLLKMFNP